MERIMNSGTYDTAMLAFQRCLEQREKLREAAVLAEQTLETVAAKFGSATEPNGCNTLPARKALAEALKPWTA